MGDVVLDPRIEERRRRVAAELSLTEAEYAARTRRWRIACFAFALLTALAGAVVVQTPAFGVREVRVQGAARTGAAEVAAATGLTRRTPLARVDTGAVARRVAALPWVDTVRVRRQLPGTVAVAVTERVPVAVVACGADAPAEAGAGGAGDACRALVDRTGRVLALAGEVPGEVDHPAAGLPLVAGVPPAGMAGSQLAGDALAPLEVARLLPPALAPMVAEVVAGEDGAVRLHLRAPDRRGSPPTVLLGPPDRVAPKLTAAATVLARTGVAGVEVLDVRVPDAPALTRAGRAGTFSPSTRG